MRISGFEQLACPLDGLPLQRGEAAWRCGAGHGFDLARQGYSHLLPVQHKRSRDPGDSKIMVAARARFLEAGFYRPIAAALSEAVLGTTAATLTLSCLDAGCGEGYYLRQLAAAAESAESASSLALMGLDISKWAVLAAAKRDKRINWVVGSNANLPVLKETLDAVICAFGFPVYREFARVLKPGGRLLRVDPGPDHLRELREIIYPALKPARERTGEAEAAACGFQRIAGQPLRYPIRLDSPQQIDDLLVMTPHMYRANAEGRSRAAALKELALTVDVSVTVLERSSAA